MSRNPKPDLIDRLLAEGVIEGPFRRPRAMTVNRWQRFLRWLRTWSNRT